MKYKIDEKNEMSKLKKGVDFCRNIWTLLTSVDCLLPSTKGEVSGKYYILIQPVFFKVARHTRALFDGSITNRTLNWILQKYIK